jgi:hypothetical protein
VKPPRLAVAERPDRLLAHRLRSGGIERDRGEPHHRVHRRKHRKPHAAAAAQLDRVLGVEHPQPDLRERAIGTEPRLAVVEQPREPLQRDALQSTVARRHEAHHLANAVAQRGWHRLHGTQLDGQIRHGRTISGRVIVKPSAMTRFTLAVTLALMIPSSSAQAGSITGTILYEGEPPTQAVMKRDADPKCSKDRADEAIVVTKGKLRDVLVRIKNGSAGKHTAPAAAVLVDQKDCMYTPRVIGIVAGQKLQVRNSDNTFHNVWGVVQNKDLFNKPQSPKAEDLVLDPSSAKPDDVVELKCGAHAWMHAYVGVQDHPYFAVTAADGKFVIKDLPKGEYTLEAWHPELGTKSMKVVIGKGKRADVTARFSYKRSD